MLLSLAGILPQQKTDAFSPFFFSSDMVKLNKPFLGVGVMCVCVCVWKVYGAAYVGKQLHVF